MFRMARKSEAKPEIDDHKDHTDDIGLKISARDIKNSGKENEINLRNVVYTSETKENESASSKILFKLRDINQKIVNAWDQVFIEHHNEVQVSQGDIFKGAPAADALVSPANSFGFMDGGIEMVYIHHFGWQMQTRLQKVIKEEYDGELLVGQAAIIPAFDEETPYSDTHFEGCNENLPIKYLISAPTMRVPLDVNNTANAYLAFRAVILAVKKHNAKVQNESEKIKSVLCPGLGTAVGCMPGFRCAYQMFQAFTVYELGKQSNLKSPPDLCIVGHHHTSMAQM